jgi:hypothetical protein
VVQGTRCVLCGRPIKSGLRCGACCQRMHRQRVKEQNPKLTLQCVECAAEYVQIDPRRIYCSGKCKKRASVRRLKSPRPSYTICAGCGKNLSRNLYCNDVCKHRAYRRRRLNSNSAQTVPCASCGDLCPIRRWDSVSFCETCAQMQFRNCDTVLKSDSVEILASPVQCVDCQSLFIRRSLSGIMPLRCSVCNHHRTRSRNMQWSGKNRAQEWHVPFENIDPYIVFEEDKWVCGICNKTVNRQLYKPDLMSPSLDHVVPLSKGGGHVRSNVQLAHLLCNIIKHNKSELAT